MVRAASSRELATLTATTAARATPSSPAAAAKNTAVSIRATPILVRCRCARRLTRAFSERVLPATPGCASAVVQASVAATDAPRNRY
jgi:hypothetical protein